MRRRDFLALIGGAVILRPLAVRAQQKAMPVIGFLSSGSPKAYAGRVAGFRKGLSEAGYIDGQNVAIEFRWAQGQYDQLPGFACHLLPLRPGTGSARRPSRRRMPQRARCRSWSSTRWASTRWRCARLTWRQPHQKRAWLSRQRTVRPAEPRSMRPR
jgi:hypothetical protein